jgi:hypothetical protein
MYYYLFLFSIPYVLADFVIREESNFLVLHAPGTSLFWEQVFSEPSRHLLAGILHGSLQRTLSESPNDWRSLEPWCKRCMFAEIADNAILRVFWVKNCRRIRQDAYFLTALQRRPQTGKSLRGHTFDKALWIVPGLVLPLNSLKTSQNITLIFLYIMYIMYSYSCAQADLMCQEWLSKLSKLIGDFFPIAVANARGLLFTGGGRLNAAT